MQAGSCLCGAVTFVVTGAPRGVAACHCRTCRKHTGAPFAVYADYQVKSVRLSGGSLKEFCSSPGATRGFCENCGSTLYYRGENLPDMIHLHVGVFDSPELFEPSTHEMSPTGSPGSITGDSFSARAGRQRSALADPDYPVTARNESGLESSPDCCDSPSERLNRAVGATHY